MPAIFSSQTWGTVLLLYCTTIRYTISIGTYQKTESISSTRPKRTTKHIKPDRTN